MPRFSRRPVVSVATVYYRMDLLKQSFGNCIETRRREGGLPRSPADLLWTDEVRTSS
ncbi:MAG: hypothetical protein RLY31_384 [Bacteroidota bacterium]|jgi:hypothetical protein